MRPKQSEVTRVAADVFTGYYRRKRLTQEELADRSDIPLTSLQRKLRGTAPITATDFVMLSQAIGVDPAEAMEEVMKELRLRETLTSEGVASISDHRRKKTPAEMTDEELEGLRHAAKFNDELEQDQPSEP
jgi:transcriptional regulator with XRE-family HTH domain